MVTEPDNEIIRLRSEVGRYRSLHARAKRKLDDERASHREEMNELKAEHAAREDALKAKIEELKHEVNKLQELHFGKSSEQSRSFSGDLAKSRSKTGGKKGPRGQQPGSSGHGRRQHSELPCREEMYKFSEEEAICAKCGLPYEQTELENVSEEVEFEVRVYRRRKRRPQYRPTCCCENVPGLISAPVPPRAFPGSDYSDNFWIEILLFKYEYQMPLQRTSDMLCGHGMKKLPPGTLCGGIERASELLAPLHEEIVKRDKSALLRHMDESDLKVFVELEGRENQRWCLWQSSTIDTCVFLLSPRHNAEVPESYLNETPQQAVVCVDRHSSYANLAQTIAYCWAHVRRDFVKLGRSERSSLGWAMEWTKRIKRIYRLNHKRQAARDEPEHFARAQADLEQVVEETRQQCEQELERPYNWRTVNRRKVLESMQRHWSGLTVFLSDPDIPMDNNAAERLFRPLANLRKACYGVHSEHFGHITAMLLSIFATLKLNNIVARPYLREYFAAVAARGGIADAETVETFLPWDLPEERQERLLQTRDPPENS